MDTVKIRTVVEDEVEYSLMALHEKSFLVNTDEYTSKNYGSVSILKVASKKLVKKSKLVALRSFVIGLAAAGVTALSVFGLFSTMGAANPFFADGFSFVGPLLLMLLSAVGIVVSIPIAGAGLFNWMEEDPYGGIVRDLKEIRNRIGANSSITDFSQAVKSVNFYSMLDLSESYKEKDKSNFINEIQSFARKLEYEGKIDRFIIDGYKYGKLRDEIVKARSVVTKNTNAEPFLVQEANKHLNKLLDKLSVLQDSRNDFTKQFKEFLTQEQETKKSVDQILSSRAKKKQSKTQNEELLEFLVQSEFVEEIRKN